MSPIPAGTPPPLTWFTTNYGVGSVDGAVPISSPSSFSAAPIAFAEPYGQTPNSALRRWDKDSRLEIVDDVRPFLVAWPCYPARFSSSTNAVERLLSAIFAVGVQTFGLGSSLLVHTCPTEALLPVVTVHGNRHQLELIANRAWSNTVMSFVMMADLTRLERSFVGSFRVRDSELEASDVSLIVAEALLDSRTLRWCVAKFVGDRDDDGDLDYSTAYECGLEATRDMVRSLKVRPSPGKTNNWFNIYLWCPGGVDKEQETSRESVTHTLLETEHFEEVLLGAPCECCSFIDHPLSHCWAANHPMFLEP